MAEKRRLQNEVDKTLKRVEEGVAGFDDILEKAHNNVTTSQKDKLENELKREIKKLQRYRDQIKAWQTSPDIKVKSPLEEARKKIEKEMERFKVCEREFKMKAFSKEGLAAKAKVDPHEEERNRHREWLNAVMTKLSTGVDEYEAECELFERKKMMSKNDIERRTILKSFVDKHHWHLTRLELILRRLENDTIDTSLLDDLKECVEFYAGEHDEPEFYNDEDMYLELNLEQSEEMYIAERKEEEEAADKDDSEEDNVTAALSNASKEDLQPIIKNEDLSSCSKLEQQALPSEEILEPIEEKPKEVTEEKPIDKPQKPSSALSSDSKESDRKNSVNLDEKNASASEPIKEASENPSSVTPEEPEAEPQEDDAVDMDLLEHILHVSHVNMPTRSDNNDSRAYNPKIPCNYHFFPVAPLNTFDSSGLFELFDLDTLFFVFFFQPGSYQQYLAATELKKQSWRFHKNHSTWFRRHETPRTTTNFYEQGIYIYFDYETEWTLRLRHEFKFEYEWLEDELNV